MSVQTSASPSTEDKVMRVVTWYRVPLMTIGTVIIAAFIYQKHAFWYGVPVSILGELIQMWATSHLHKDTKFTISGPYAHVRNPMYFGRFFVGLGIFIMTWNPILITIYVLYYVIYGNMRVKREEKRLSEIFAPHYQDYCSEVHRWIPRFKPYSKAEARGAKWSQVCANHEQIVALGIIIVLIALYFRIDKLPNLHW